MWGGPLQHLCIWDLNECTQFSSPLISIPFLILILFISTSSGFEFASAKAAQHRLGRGVWTSVHFGDMRRALAGMFILCIKEPPLFLSHLFSKCLHFKYSFHAVWFIVVLHWLQIVDLFFFLAGSYYRCSHMKILMFFHLTACERLILLRHDLSELRDYSVLLYHCGFFEESLEYLKLYQDSMVNFLNLIQIWAVRVNIGCCEPCLQFHSRGSVLVIHRVDEGCFKNIPMIPPCVCVCVWIILVLVIINLHSTDQWVRIFQF